MSDTENTTTETVDNAPTKVDTTEQVVSMQAQIDKLTASLKTSEVKEPPQEPLTSVATQAKIVKDKADAEIVRDKITKVVSYVSNFQSLIDKNKDLLPEECQFIKSFYDDKDSSEDDRYYGYRSDLADNFFKSDENIKLLDGDIYKKHRSAVTKWMARDVMKQDPKALELVSEAFAMALHSKGLLTKQAQVNNANNVNNGYVGNTDDSVMQMYIDYVQAPSPEIAKDANKRLNMKMSELRSRVQ